MHKHLKNNSKITKTIKVYGFTMLYYFYAASMLAIEVDTVAEQNYRKSLASGLDLNTQVVFYINRTMGVKHA